MRLGSPRFRRTIIVTVNDVNAKLHFARASELEDLFLALPIMPLHRRKFLESSGIVALGTLLPSVSRLTSASGPAEPFQWKSDSLLFTFDVMAGRLRQKRLIPADASLSDNSSGVEVALQCSGEN